jgi:hypothetical protein
MTARLVLFLLCALLLAALGAEAAGKSAEMHADTPKPRRFVVEDGRLMDRSSGLPVAFRGIGYSPYLRGETPQQGAGPGNDGRYPGHLELIRGMGVNYLHVFPMRMPANFFTALAATDLVYGQDIWIDPISEDILDPAYQEKTLASIRQVIDHTYAIGRPDRLVLFSVGDELQAATVEQTNKRHPEVRDYRGQHLTVNGRSASEVALARLIDQALAYELERYGQRHLYCHTSWTHIGPLAERPDLDIPRAHVLVPDMGDLLCMNIYTYAHGVISSPAGSVTGSPFQGYLEELAASSRQPILLTQVGFSTSPIKPRPELVEYGGQDPGALPPRLRALWRDFRTARGAERYSGLVFFEFNDEWWKIGWVSGDENQHEPADPEEWFGLFALDANNRLVPKGDLPETVRELFTGP